jgi:hypothetical protein
VVTQLHHLCQVFHDSTFPVSTSNPFDSGLFGRRVVARLLNSRAKNSHQGNHLRNKESPKNQSIPAGGNRYGSFILGIEQWFVFGFDLRSIQPGVIRKQCNYQDVLGIQTYENTSGRG